MSGIFWGIVWHTDSQVQKSLIGSYHDWHVTYEQMLDLSSLYAGRSNVEYLRGPQFADNEDFEGLIYSVAKDIN